MFTFGLPPPEGHKPKYWWGARAIFTNKWERNYRRMSKKDPEFIQFVEVALLYDRQSFLGPSIPISGELSDGDKKFTDWIDKVGLPAVREWAKKVSTDSREEFTLSNGGYQILATPNGSYGYMYIGAWSHEEREEVA